LQDSQLFSDDEIRRKIKSYAGKVGRRNYTTLEWKNIYLADICNLCSITSPFLSKWVNKRVPYMSLKTKTKICRILALLDEGRITRNEQGEYTIHDAPMVPPKKQLRVNIGGKGISFLKPVQQPKINDIFGRNRYGIT